jgi:hypothetical protein
MRAGRPDRLDSFASGLDVRGAVTLHGKTYEPIGGLQPGDDPGVLLEFKGETLIAPPFTDAHGCHGDRRRERTCGVNPLA